MIPKCTIAAALADRTHQHKVGALTEPSRTRHEQKGTCSPAERSSTGKPVYDLFASFATHFSPHLSPNVSMCVCVCVLFGIAERKRCIIVAMLCEPACVYYYVVCDLDHVRRTSRSARRRSRSITHVQQNDVPLAACHHAAKGGSRGGRGLLFLGRCKRTRSIGISLWPEKGQILTDCANGGRHSENCLCVR